MAKRDLKKWEELWREWSQQAYRFAFRLSGHEHDAQDMAQEAFSRAFDHWDRYDETRPFETWLFEILRNVYLDAVRRAHRRPEISLDRESPSARDEDGASAAGRLAGPEPTPLESLARREEEAVIRRVLAGLPEHYRAALVLRDLEGLSYEAIGKILDCPVGTIRSRLHQGRLLAGRAFREFESNKKGVIYD